MCAPHQNWYFQDCSDGEEDWIHWDELEDDVAWGGMTKAEDDRNGPDVYFFIPNN